MTTYTIRTKQGSDIETDEIERNEAGINYAGVEASGLAGHGAGFIPYTSIDRVDVGGRVDAAEFGVASPDPNTESAETPSDDADDESEEGESHASEDSTEVAEDDESRLEQAVEAGRVEDITLDDLEGVVSEEGSVDVLEEASEQDDRKGAQDLYDDRIDGIGG